MYVKNEEEKKFTIADNGILWRGLLMMTTESEDKSKLFKEKVLKQNNEKIIGWNSKLPPKWSKARNAKW